MRFRALALVAVMASCRERPSAPEDAAAAAPPPLTDMPPASAAPATSASPAASAPAASAAPPASVSAPPPASASASAAAPAGSAAAGAADAPECRLGRGPVRLEMHGPALLWAEGGAAAGGFRVLFNRDGAAHPIAPAFPQLAPPGSTAPPAPPGSTAPPAPPGSTAPPAPSAAPSAAAAPPPAERATWPACVVAGSFSYCMELGGSIRRSPLAGGEGKPVAFGRRGAAIAAVGLPGDYTALAFLGDRKTTEGIVTQAFVALDDSPAVLLSEEGSGATFVALAPWKDGALAMYIDARVALTPVHARVLRRGGDGRLEIGPDAVIFVGGGSEVRMTGAIATGASGPAHVLVPTSHGVSGFGMAAIRVDDPPKYDEPVTWSMYPNGLSPAPIAVTRGASPIRVARVRPVAAQPGSRAALEIGVLGEDGAFTPRCVAAESASFSHVALEVDAGGALWLAYTAADGTWVEQRGGAPAARRAP